MTEPPTEPPPKQPAQEAAPTQASPTKRLHAATLWVPLVETALTLIIPAIILSFIFRPEIALRITGLYILVPSGVFFVLRYLTTRYQLHPTEILIRSGMIFRRERRIPLERIQDLDLHQSLLRRWLHLASIKLNTAGAETEEATLDVLTVAEAERLRRKISRFHSTDASPSDDQHLASKATTETLCRLNWRELALGGITSNLMAALGAILGAFLYLTTFESWDLGRFDRKIENVIEGQLERIESQSRLGKWGVRAVNFFFFSGSFGKALIFAIVGACGSITGFIIRYHGFRLRRTGNITTRTYGLFTIRRTTLPQNRIQAIKIDEGWLRRVFSLATIRADTASDQKEIDEANKRELLVPIARKDQAHKIVRQLQPKLDSDDWEWKSVSRLAIMRRTKLAWLLILAGMLQTGFWLQWFVLIWLPTFPLAYFLNYKWYLNTKYSVTSSHVMWKLGWLNRSTLFLPIRNIQNVTLTQNPFDRQLGLATISIDTAGQSNTGGGPTIRHLPHNDALELQSHLIKRVQKTPFHW